MTRVRIGSPLRIVGINLLVLAGLLVAIEGIASYVLVGHRLVRENRVPAERKHTQYDPELGWVNVPNLDIPDMYGPRRRLRTNSQGFRNDHDIAGTVPPGKHRVICSGDSHALGYGVADHHTWCARLAALDPRLETVNMGQGGYGVDQAFLWFRRDARALQHHLHLFTFITTDFQRMQSDTFAGYAKPVLRLEHGALVTANVPVPTRSYTLGRLLPRVLTLEELRVVELARLSLRRLGLLAAPPRETATDEQTRHVAAKIFEDLRDMNAQRGSRLVLVYLPSIVPNDHAEWSRFVHVTADRLGVPLVDVWSEFQRFAPEERAGLFFATHRHLNERGNAVVAAMICTAITRLPPLSERTQAVACGPDGPR